MLFNRVSKQCCKKSILEQLWAQKQTLQQVQLPASIHYSQRFCSTSGDQWSNSDQSNLGGNLKVQISEDLTKQQFYLGLRHYFEQGDQILPTQRGLNIPAKLALKMDDVFDIVNQLDQDYQGHVARLDSSIIVSVKTVEQNGALQRCVDIRRYNQSLPQVMDSSVNAEAHAQALRHSFYPTKYGVIMNQAQWQEFQKQFANYKGKLERQTGQAKGNDRM